MSSSRRPLRYPGRGRRPSCPAGAAGATRVGEFPGEPSLSGPSSAPLPCSGALAETGCHGGPSFAHENRRGPSFAHEWRHILLSFMHPARCRVAPFCVSAGRNIGRRGTRRPSHRRCVRKKGLPCAKESATRLLCAKECAKRLSRARERAMWRGCGGLAAPARVPRESIVRMEERGARRHTRKERMRAARACGMLGATTAMAEPAIRPRATPSTDGAGHGARGRSRP